MPDSAFWEGSVQLSTNAGFTRQNSLLQPFWEDSVHPSTSPRHNTPYSAILGGPVQLSTRTGFPRQSFPNSAILGGPCAVVNQIIYVPRQNSFDSAILGGFCVVVHQRKFHQTEPARFGHSGRVLCKCPQKHGNRFFAAVHPNLSP